MDMFGENFRGLHALKLLTGSRGWTLEKLQAAAFDSYQPGFAALISSLLQAYAVLPVNDPRRARLEQPIAVLRPWDYRWSGQSVAQTLAMFWGDAMQKALNAPADEPGNKRMMRLARDTTPEQKVQALDDAVARLTREFGGWRAPWGEVNRFQRISPAIVQPFNDSAPSIPVPFASSAYGSLAAFGASPKPGTSNGTARPATVSSPWSSWPARARPCRQRGGESGDPASPHFNDEALRYASGNLREVYFWPDQLKGHIEKT